MFTIPAPDRAETLARQARAIRYSQRELLNGLSAIPRIQACGRFRAVDEHGVGIVQNPSSGRCHYRNVQLCASVHACPVCSAAIRRGRADEIMQAASRHLELGGGLEFATFTLPHDRGDELGALLTAIGKAYRAVVSGKTAQKRSEAYGLDGSIRALEVNHGPNGWHPHYHVLLFTRTPLGARARQELRRSLSVAWAGAIQKQGYRRPSVRRGVDVRRVHAVAGIGRYVAKVANELTRVDLKKGRWGTHRSAWQILSDLHRDGDTADLALWWEYELATKGKRAVFWSHGLKGRYGVGEQSDDELAAENVGGEELATVSPALWPIVSKVRGLRHELLRVGEEEGRDGLDELLAKVELLAFGELHDVSSGGHFRRPLPIEEFRLAVRRVDRARQRILAPKPLVEGLPGLACRSRNLRS